MKVTLNAHILFFDEFFSNTLKSILHLVENRKKLTSLCQFFRILHEIWRCFWKKVHQRVMYLKKFLWQNLARRIFLQTLTLGNIKLQAYHSSKRILHWYICEEHISQNIDIFSYTSYVEYIWRNKPNAEEA